MILPPARSRKSAQKAWRNSHFDQSGEKIRQVEELVDCSVRFQVLRSLIALQHSSRT